MTAPQRPTRRAPQDAQNNAVTRGASSTACRRRKPPCLRAGCNPSDAPRQTGHGQAAPGSLPQAPVIGFPRRRSPPAQHLSSPPPAEPPRSIPPTLVRQAPGRPRRTFETPVSARTFARLPPMSAFSRPPADEQTTTRKRAVRRSPQHAASASSPPPRGPPARFRSLTFSRQPRFRRIRADRRASPNALSEATFIRVRSAGLQFSARLRSSRAQPPPCFRSPRGFRLLPRAPLSLWFPRPIPRLFLRLPRSSAALYPAFLRLICEKASRSLRRCAKPLQCRASSRTAPRPAQQLPRNVFRRSQLANIKQLLRSRRDCDHAFIAVRSPFPIPRCRARQRFFRIFSSRNPLL